ESSARETSPLFELLGRQPAEPEWGTLNELYTQLAYWTAAKRSAEPRQVRRYLERFPEGHFALSAQWIRWKLSHPCRSAAAGSTVLARRAGRQMLATAAALMSSTTAM
ncbi:MAG: hypothetical protein V3T72_03315, partial [Thermoanaerobaculia bacterium]